VGSTVGVQRCATQGLLHRGPGAATNTTGTSTCSAWAASTANAWNRVAPELLFKLGELPGEHTQRAV